MQLQRSLFSFYKVFIRKTPVCIWLILGIILLAIIGWEIRQIGNEQEVYNFEKCIIQYYNATRKGEPAIQNVESDSQKVDKNSQSIDINNKASSSQKQESKIQKIPYYLQGDYYKIVNKTTTIKIYLSDQIVYSPGEASCKIILNTQRIKARGIEQKVQIKEDNEESKEESIKAVILQQVQKGKQTGSEDKKVGEVKTNQDQGNKRKPQSEKQPINDVQAQQLPSKQDQKQTIKQATLLKSEQKDLKNLDNVKNYNQITAQQQNLVLNQHPYLHLALNSHIVYLDQNNSFQSKHNIQIHAIIISKQSLNIYPKSLFGLSSKLWRLHGNQDIARNQLTLKSIAQTFSKVNNDLKNLHKLEIMFINQQIALKQAAQFIDKIKNNQSYNTTSQTEIQKPQNSQNQVAQNIKSGQKAQLKSTQPVNENQVNAKNSTFINSLPKNLVPYYEISPLEELKVYFHYPQVLRYQQLIKLVAAVQTNSGFIVNTIFLIFMVCQLCLISVLVGLLVRYLFFLIITIYLFLGGCLVNKQWGWVFKYFNLVKNRLNTENNFSLISSCKMLFFFVIALLGMLTIFTMGSKSIILDLYIYGMPFCQTYYSEMMLKNIFLIQLFYYICCRSRIALKYFPRFSLKISILIVFLNSMFYFYNITWLINLHLWTHIFLMCIFSILQNIIGHQPFYSQYTPSEQKPRSLYYIGYDISWQNTLPPIWTYFTTNFDLKYFSQKQKCLIEKDYQLLYGRLLGMNQRQQLPQEQERENQEQIHKLNQNLSESNEMSLIR